MPYPSNLQSIVDFFEGLGEEEKRENLIAFSLQAGQYAPRKGEVFDLEDVRQDEGCVDRVGIHIRVSEGTRVVTLRVSLGPRVQTLTKAMAAILCKGLNGAKLEEIGNLEDDFVSRIVGSALVRARSQTVYYVLRRIQEICREWSADKTQRS